MRLVLSAHWVDNGRTLGGQVLAWVVGWFLVVLTLDFGYACLDFGYVCFGFGYACEFGAEMVD